MSDLNHVTFTGAIREAASKLGRVPTAEQVQELNAELQRLADLDDETQVITIASTEGFIPLPDFMAKRMVSFPQAAVGTIDRDVNDDDRAPLRIGNGVQYGRRDAFADIVRAIQVRDAEALAREAAGWSNPWRKGHENRTRQTIISKIDPAKAARYRAEAGSQ